MLSKSAEKCQHLVFAGIWQSPGKSVRVNDLDHCSQGVCHLVCRGSSRGRGGGWRGDGGEICLNLAVRNLAHRYWQMTSFRHGKRAGGNLQQGVSYLPAAAMHCGYKSIFSTGKCRLQTLYSFYFYSSFKNLTLQMFYLPVVSADFWRYVTKCHKTPRNKVIQVNLKIQNGLKRSLNEIQQHLEVTACACLCQCLHS